jgi:hypothetical protein
MNGSQNGPLPQNGFAPAAAATLDKRIDAALEHKPAPHIPDDFAVRVTLRLAARAALTQRRRVSSFPIGRSLAWASAAILSVALFALAPHATPSITSLSFDAELLLLVELAGLGWVLARGFGTRLSQ